MAVDFEKMERDLEIIKFDLKKLAENKMPEDRWLQVAEAAKIAGVSPKVLKARSALGIYTKHPKGWLLSEILNK